MILLKSSSNNSPHTTHTLGGAYGCAVQLRSYKQILVPKCSHKKECCFKWLETNRFKEIQSVLLLLLLQKSLKCRNVNSLRLLTFGLTIAFWRLFRCYLRSHLRDGLVFHDHLWGYLLGFSHFWGYLLGFSHFWGYLLGFSHFCCFDDLHLCLCGGFSDFRSRFYHSGFDLCDFCDNLGRHIGLDTRFNCFRCSHFN